MIRITSLALVTAAAAVALVVTGPIAAAPPVVKGTVGPGFTISLTKGGKKVTSLKAGVRYRFDITDRSSIHDFHLSGPGTNKVITGVGFTGNKSVTLTLKRGTYRYVCDPHRDFMKGSFRVA
ncbi:MAG TPA: plastocyanin/azurin family copper-binding protein [Gaiellaceae bacterium]|nr:plastocyanin/azurin family copper-binding protein [Gaiellaceae bacterium]